VEPRRYRRKWLERSFIKRSIYQIRFFVKMTQEKNIAFFFVVVFFLSKSRRRVYAWWHGSSDLLQHLARA